MLHTHELIKSGRCLKSPCCNRTLATSYARAVATYGTFFTAFRAILQRNRTQNSNYPSTRMRLYNAHWFDLKIGGISVLSKSHTKPSHMQRLGPSWLEVVACESVPIHRHLYNIRHSKPHGSYRRSFAGRSFQDFCCRALRDFYRSFTVDPTAPPSFYQGFVLTCHPQILLYRP